MAGVVLRLVIKRDTWQRLQGVAEQERRPAYMQAELMLEQAVSAASRRAAKTRTPKGGA